MITQNAYMDLGIESEYTKIRVRCYMAAIHGEVLKAALLAGPEQLCVGAFSNMVQEGSLLFVDGKRHTKDEFRYRRMVAHLPCKWVTMLILSKDPCCLWQDDDLGLIAGIKKITETPFLNEWVPYIRGKLEEGKHLVKMVGHNAIGSMINCSTEVTDAIVTDGIKQQHLSLR